MRFHKPSSRRLVVASCLAVSLLGLVALLLLLLMASHDYKGDNVNSETFSHDDRGAASAAADAFALRGYKESPCTLQKSCYVMCQNTEDYLLSSSISQLLEDNEECARSMTLEVNNVAFANNTLAPGWLDVRANLSSLILSDCHIDAFHDDAFSTSQFVNLTELNMKGLTLQKLQRAVVRPLRSLTSLSLDDCPDLQEVDQGVTAVLHKLRTLQVLRTIYPSNRHILPAFAGSVSNKVIVDLRFNELGTLQHEDLGSAAVSATSLYLKGSGIEDVLVGTFPSSEYRQQLSLSNNNLTTLRNMSISFENRFSKFAIYLGNNPWHCDCSLLWLLPYVSTFADTPVCSTPKYFATWNLTSALELLNDACAVCSSTLPPSTTTTESSIETSGPTETSDIPTTETPSNCGSDSTATTEEIPSPAPPDKRPDDLKACYHADLPEHEAVDGWSQDSVHIYDVDDFTLKVSVPYNAAGGFLVWKGVDSPDCYETSPLTSPTVVLENLKPGVDYNICVLGPEEMRTSIHNCLPHRTMSESSVVTRTSDFDIPPAVSMSVVGLSLMSVGIVVLLYITTPKKISLPSWWPQKSPRYQRYYSPPSSTRPSDLESFSSTSELLPQH